MAQPNVAREPSMEEILASIRRIIESNEPGQGGEFSLGDDYDDLRAQAQSGQGEPQSAMASSAAYVPPAHVPPAANQAYAQRQAVDNRDANPSNIGGDASGEKSMSLADVAARVRAAADRNAAIAANGGRPIAPHTPAQEAPAATTANYFGDMPQRSQRPGDVRPLLAQTQPAQEPVDAWVSANAARLVEAPPAQWGDVALRREAIGQITPTEAEVRYTAPAAREEPIAVQPEVPVQPTPSNSELSPLSMNLLSEMAEQQIASSFGALEDIFNGVDQPSVDEMARDMLRPMLQDWLEDNLPTIVERLVREEIARVVRGPKR